MHNMRTWEAKIDVHQARGKKTTQNTQHGLKFVLKMFSEIKENLQEFSNSLNVVVKRYSGMKVAFQGNIEGMNVRRYRCSRELIKL